MIAEAIRDLYIYIDRGEEEIEDKFYTELPPEEEETEEEESSTEPAETEPQNTDEPAPQTTDEPETQNTEPTTDEPTNTTTEPTPVPESLDVTEPLTDVDEEEEEDPDIDLDLAPLYFEDDLKTDEKKWVILTAAIDFFRKVQSQYDGLTSYTTDAMAVTHGDAPFKNLGAKIDDLKGERDVVWWRMVRHNML
jgi:hypothetical protein